MKSFLTNYSSQFSGEVRYAMFEGRRFIVAPLTMIVPGVLNGSKGALYYPPEEVALNDGIWNHVPLVVYHPSVNGMPVSARNPEILEQQGIGFVFNDHFDGTKRVAEGWFDIEKCRRVDNRVLRRLERGLPIELSTGLFTDNYPAANGANHNGKPYRYVARNYRPDHLAILPDQKGACSLTDGCGVNARSHRDVRISNGWVTTKTGTHIFIEDGEITKGPKALVQKQPKAQKTKSSSRDEEYHRSLDRYNAHRTGKGKGSSQGAGKAPSGSKTDLADDIARGEGFKDAADKARFEESSSRQDRREASQSKRDQAKATAREKAIKQDQKKMNSPAEKARREQAIKDHEARKWGHKDHASRMAKTKQAKAEAKQAMKDIRESKKLGKQFMKTAKAPGNDRAARAKAAKVARSATAGARPSRKASLWGRVKTFLFGKHGLGFNSAAWGQLTANAETPLPRWGR